MAVPVPVTISTDFSFGGSFHYYVPIPVPAPPTVLPAVEIPIPQAWPVGVALGSVKKTSSVMVNGRAAIQAGHDCGKLIPQFTIPINNALLPLHLASSSRETIVKCFSVRMDKLQTACTTFWLPMLSCGNPVSVPWAFTPTNIMRGVFVGASAADFVGAVVQTLTRMALEWVFKVAPGAKLPFAKEFQKAVVGALAGGLASGVQHLMDPQYPISAEFKLKLSKGWEVSIGVSCASSDTKNNPSQVTASIAKKLSPDLTAGQVAAGKASASATWTWDAGGDTSKEGWQAEVAAQGGVGAIGGKAGVSGEYHGDAPEGQQTKGTVQAKATTPIGSASTQVDANPDAPAGQRTTVKQEVSTDVPPGVHKETTVKNPDGSTKTTTTSSDGWQPPSIPSAPPPVPKGAGWQPPAGAGIWGDPL